MRSFFRESCLSACKRFSGNLLQPLRWAWVLTLSSVTFAQVPSFTVQTPLPTIVKSDWDTSSFNSDGTLFLAVSAERSIVIDVKSGRLLRDVARDMELVAAVKDEDPGHFLALNTRAQMVSVDARNGSAVVLVQLPTPRGTAYASPDASMVRMGTKRVAVLLTSKMEHTSGKSIARDEHRQILMVDAQARKVLGTVQVDPHWRTNLNARLTGGDGVGLIAVQEYKGEGDIALWRADESGTVTFACTVAAPEKRVVGIHSFNGGLALLQSDGTTSRVTTRTTGDNCETERLTLPCKDGQGSRSLLASLQGRRAGELLVIDDGLNARFASLADGTCGQEIPLAQHDSLSRLQRRLGYPQEKQDDPRAFIGKPIGTATGVDPQFALLLNGALVHMPSGNLPVRHVADLVGPTGLGEIEIAGGMLAGVLPLSPVRLIDLQTLSMRTVNYDVASAQEKSFFFNRSYALARDLKAVFVVQSDGQVFFRSLDPTFGSVRGPPPQTLEKDIVALCVSADGLKVWASTANNGVVAYARRKLVDPLVKLGTLRPAKKEGFAYKIACDGRGDTAVVGDSLSDGIRVMSLLNGKPRIQQRITVPGSARQTKRPSMTADGNIFAIGRTLWSRRSGGSFKQGVSVPDAEHLVLDTSGSKLLAIGEDSSIRALARSPDGVLSLGSTVKALGRVGDAGFLDAAHAVLLRTPNELDIVSLSDGTRIGSLAFGDEGEWVFVDVASRFDTNSIEKLGSGHWVMKDAPLTPLPVEIFARDYYEPRLLARSIACRAASTEGAQCAAVLPPRPPLNTLNRVLPTVRITSVTQGPDSTRATVEVEVSRVEDPTQPNGKTRTDPFDLRLFRDGQLVARWPESDTVEAGFADWRSTSRITIPASDVSRRHAFDVALPGAAGNVSFTAYAYNEDRVKSITSDPANLKVLGTSLKRKAYLITIGVNGYEAASHNLAYAVRDAQVLSQALSRLDGYEVVSVDLSSEIDRSQWRATKHNIREVLMRLAGKQADPEALAAIPNADKLARTTPDDIVVVTFSGHGHTEPNGRFYLLPSDSGPTFPPTPTTLTSSISSEELGAWLYSVDAGRIVLVVDACHSAASVAQPGFKPGPMGDRGLGQLAYDKKMLVLAASQAEDVALESNSLQQGLLTYALVTDGLGDGLPADIDGDGAIPLSEWLAYGARRTPGVYEDLKANVLGVRLIRRDTGVLADAQDVASRAQTPVLFDFTRGATLPLIRP